MKTLRSLIIGCCISSLTFAADAAEKSSIVDESQVEVAAVETSGESKDAQEEVRQVADDELLAAQVAEGDRDDGEFAFKLGLRSDEIEKNSDEDNVLLISKLTGAGGSDLQTDGAYGRCRASRDENGHQVGRWTCMKYSIRRWIKDNL